MRKMGQHGSPTGEVFLSDVRAGRDRLLGEREDPRAGADKARATTSSPSVPASPPCPSASSKSASNSRSTTRSTVGSGNGHRGLSTHPTQTRADGSGARERSQHGVRPYRALVARRVPSFAEASAMKLYSAQRPARWPTTRFRFLVATATSPSTGSSNSVVTRESFVSTPARRNAGHRDRERPHSRLVRHATE